MSEDGSGCQERMAALEEDLEALEDRFQAWRKHSANPRFDKLETRSDDARSERAELRATVQDLESEVANLQFTLEALKGLGENEQSTPAARVRDLRATMIERAQTLENRKGIKLWWEEVQDLFADLGHGQVKAPGCFDAMETAAEADGFELDTKVNEKGNEVKAIRLETAALPTPEGVSDPKNSNGVIGGQNGGESAEEGNSD